MNYIFQCNFFFDITRSEHVESSPSYTCIECNETFTAWKSFKRHNREKHGEAPVYFCQSCNYNTKRQHDLKKHVLRKHSGSLNVVSSILEDIVSNASQDQESAEGSDDLTRSLGLEEEYDLNQGNVLELRDNDKDSSDSCEYDDDASYHNESSSVDNLDELNVVDRTSQVCEYSEYEMIRMKIIAERDAAFRELYPSFGEELKALKFRKSRKKRSKAPSDNLPTRTSSRIRNKMLVDDFTEPNVNLGIRDDVNMSENGEVIVDLVSSSGDGTGTIADEWESREVEAVCDSEDAMVAETEADVGDPCGQGEEIHLSETSRECENSFQGEDVTDSDFSASTLGKYACLPCEKSFR